MSPRWLERALLSRVTFGVVLAVAALAFGMLIWGEL
jgi:hypothetical protein